MARIICLGMSALDAIYRVPAIPSTPVKVLASAFTECGGGMPANASVAVARLGGKAAYWGRVGADEVGARIVAELAAEGVDTSSVRRLRGALSSSDAILVDPNGERLICAYTDPALDPDPSWLPLASVARFDAVLADVRWPAGAARLLEAATAAGLPAVFDGDVGPPETLIDLARRATHVAFSPPGQLAAGDVWLGAFALGLGERMDIPAAARFANAAAALKCIRVGGRRGAPTRQEVSDLLAGLT